MQSLFFVINIAQKYKAHSAGTFDYSIEHVT
jgi:hypothetical protein